MVKLPPEDLNLENLREWMYHYRMSQEKRVPPIRLMELEEYSELAASHMHLSFLPIIPEVHNKYRQTAMDRIRQLFNMEFKLRCDVCGTAHRQDEISAPER